MTEAEQALINDLNAIKTQQEKIAGEITALKASSNTLQETIAALEQQLAGNGSGGETGTGVPSAELVAAVAAVKTQAQALDDLIPDAPPVPA